MPEIYEYRGVEGLVYAEVTADTAENYTTGTVKDLAGVATISKSTASTNEAYEASRMMAKREGVLVGISSGAALHGALLLAKKQENKGKNIVVILPDTGDRYLSTDLF